MLQRTMAGIGILGLGVLVAAACSENTPTDTVDTPAEQSARAAASAGGASGSTTTHGRRATTLRTDLDELNDSGADGQATVVLKGDELMVTLQARGLSANLPHAQHIHIGGMNTCPTSDLAGEDGLISTAEGLPAYGRVRVSLTTEGDVSAASGLAIPRFPVANRAGVVTYQRTFQLPDGVAASDISEGVIVVHGISELFGDPTAYDGDPESSLAPNLPLEATIPSLCGELSSPSGR